MNKEKIIQMIEDYGSKQYEAGVNYGPADDMDADDFKDLQMRIYNIKNELNSKPVMPKVWTDWFETYNLPLHKLQNSKSGDRNDETN